MISFNQFFSGVIPEVPTAGVLSFLEAGDLAALRRVGSSNARTHDLMTRAWRGIEASLEYSAKESSEDAIDPNSHRFREYNNTVKDLVVRINKYLEQVPSEIKEIIKVAMEGDPTLAQVQRLQEFIKARDTLVVWEKIAEQAEIDLDLSEAYESADMAIDQAKEFSAWLKKEENHDPLESLQRLYLDNNKLTTLPPEIGQLGSLLELWLVGNQLTSLPPEVGELGSLQGLSLDDNQLTTLPPEVGQLGSLRKLWLSGNQFTSLPSEVGQLGNLRELWLMGNQLSSFPPAIERLTRLRKLELCDNQLTTLPTAIGRLGSLRSLSLTNNQLTTLPPAIGQLGSLEWLYLENNQLTSLPLEIGNLTSLQQLGLAGNQLTTLPTAIGRLGSLRSLNLTNNQLTTLPPEIAQLGSLWGLWLENNQLNSIPEEVQALPHFSNFHFSDNPIPYVARLNLFYSQFSLFDRLPDTEMSIGLVLSAALLSVGAYYYSEEISSVAQSVSTIAEQFFSG